MQNEIHKQKTGTDGTTLKNMDVFNKLSGTSEQKVPGKNHCNSLYNNVVPGVPDGMTGFDGKK